MILSQECIPALGTCAQEKVLPAYDYLALHDYSGFITHYGLPFIALFVGFTVLFHFMGLFFAWYYTEKAQKDRMKQLPGIYR